jgi:hypothetical protein
MTRFDKGEFVKRKYHRYPAKEGVIVAFKPHGKILGQMIDISLGGLAFRYIDSEKQPDDADQLIILVAHHNFRLDNVPFRTVSDQAIANTISFSSIKMRRRNVEFGNLSIIQVSAVNDFIMNYTVMSSKQRDQNQPYQRQASAIFQQI